MNYKIIFVSLLFWLLTLNTATVWADIKFGTVFPATLNFVDSEIVCLMDCKWPSHRKAHRIQAFW